MIVRKYWSTVIFAVGSCLILPLLLATLGIYYISTGVHKTLVKASPEGLVTAHRVDGKPRVDIITVDKVISAVPLCFA